MPRYVAYAVYKDPFSGQAPGERYELVDMKGRVLRDKADMLKWLLVEVPRDRPDLRGVRIDVVDLDEPIDAH